MKTQWITTGIAYRKTFRFRMSSFGLGVEAVYPGWAPGWASNAARKYRAGDETGAFALIKLNWSGTLDWTR